MKGHHHIARSDHRGFHGWTVRIKRRGRWHVEYFDDQASGGRDAAERVALAYRDEALGTLGPALRVSSRDVRNRTGVVGVHEDWSKTSDGRIHRAYRASWPDGRGRTVRRWFSIAKYGENRALELAIKARRTGLRALTALKRLDLEAELVVARGDATAVARARGNGSRPPKV